MPVPFSQKTQDGGSGTWSGHTESGDSGSTGPKQIFLWQAEVGSIWSTLQGQLGPRHGTATSCLTLGPGWEAPAGRCVIEP